MAWHAYQRKEGDSLTLAYPIDKVWATAQVALGSLDWKVEIIDPLRRMRVKTKASLMAWGSTLLIDVMSIDENISKVQILAVTRGQMLDYGRTRKRIEMFFGALQKQLGS